MTKMDFYDLIHFYSQVIDMLNIQFSVFIFDFELLRNRVLVEIVGLFDQEHGIFGSRNDDFDVFGFFADKESYITKNINRLCLGLL